MSIFDQRYQRVDTQINIAFQPPREPPLQRPRRVEYFTGREDELRQIRENLQPGRVVTLCGPGGIGKTALAAEVIWLLAPGDDPPDRFPDGVFFHGFYDHPGTDLALEAIARAYGEEPKPTPRAAAARALSGRVALLVLDGAENADDLQAMLSVAGCCGVLITSRPHLPNVANWLDIRPLLDSEAVEVLQAWGGGCASDEAAVARICELVGQLPLALRLAGSYLARCQQDADDYLTWLEESGLAALDFGKQQDESVPVLMEHSVAQVSKAGREALSVAGIVALASFDPAAVAKALEMSVSAAGRALGELVEYGLLLRDQDGRYQVSHALVHTYARQHRAPAVEVMSQLAAYYVAFAKEQSRAGLEGYARLDAERAHIMAVLENCVRREAWEAVRSLVLAVDEYLELRGYWTQRVDALTIGVSTAGALKRYYDEGDLIHRLGNAYHDVGQIDRAIEYHRQALATARKIDDRQGEGTELGELGNDYSALGQVDQAIEYYQQALSIHREIGERHSEGAWLGNLGLAYRTLGQVEKAIEFHKQALEIARETDDRRAEAIQLGNLGSAYDMLGEVNVGIEHHKQALLIAQETGHRHGEADNLGNIGLAYHTLGQPDQAIECHKQALAIHREIGDRGGEGTDLGNLANAYRDLGQVYQSIKYAEQALDIAREIGDRHGKGNALGHLGNAYRDLGRVKRAIEFHEQALAIARKIGDPFLEEDALGSLGLDSRDLGQLAQAIEYLKQALSIARKIRDRQCEALHAWNLGFLHEETDPARAVALMSLRVAYRREIGHPDAEADAERVSKI